MIEKDLEIEKLMSQIYICFESSHNERVQIEAVQYSEFIDKLVEMNFKLGMLKKAPVTLDKISDYNVIIIGAPIENQFSDDEIKVFKEYVYQGGSLFILNDQGGDPTNKNNLSKLTREFGIMFKTNVLINKNAEDDEDEQLITISDFYNHFIMRGIEKIALKSPCSLVILDNVPNANPSAVAFTGPFTSELEWDGNRWVEKKGSKIPVVAISKYGAGKIVALGTTRILSSLINKKHGFNAVNNSKFISNVFAWLVNKEIYEDGKLKSVFVNVSLKPDMYFWIEKELKNHDKFRDFNEVVNFALEALSVSLDRYRKENKK
ncbi:MAG: hypothetical protein ACTSXU_03525 [Promethearchaeota archaeon]